MPAAALPSDLSASPDLLHDLLAVSLTALHVVSPLYGPDGTTVVDFSLDYLNPAGQRMTGLPERPGGTALTRFPHTLATGVFEYYQRVFDTGEARFYEVNYQADGLDNYYRFHARRSGEQLVVSFTDTADQNRSAVEVALRESQAREQAARAEAEAQRQRFYDVLLQLPALIATYHGPEHTYSFVNPAYQRYFNRDVQLLGRSIREVLPEAEEQGVFALMDRVYQTGEPYYVPELEVWLDHTGGAAPRQQLFLSLLFHPLRDAQGQVTGLLDFSYDITEQVLARRQVEQLNQQLESSVQARTQELALAQAETDAQRQRLHQLVAEAPALIASLRGPEHVVELANDGFRAIFGGRELVGKTYRQAIPEFASQPFFDYLDRVYRTGETYYGIDEPVILDRTNSGQLERTFITYTYQATRDAQGQIDGILVFCYEVTEQVLARQEREQQRLQLARVFEQAPVAVALLQGPDYVIEVANARVAELWGRTPDQVVGRPLLEALPEVRGQGFKELLDQVVATGEAFVAQDVSAQLLRHGQLETVYLNFVYQPLRDAAGQIGSVVAVAVDVTEQALARQQVQHLNEELAAINEEMQATNEELNDTNTQLQRTNTDLDTFVYAASHDLKAPIANIEGLLEALREYLPTHAQEPMVPRLVGMMEGAIGRFQQTVAHLTDVTRLQAESEPLTSDLDVPGVLKDVRLDLRPLLESTRTELLLEVPACPGVRLPVKHLRSILFNLLSNAVKYRAPDRAPLVQVRAQCAAGRFVLEVQDNGLGLSKEQQGQLFTMFKRLHTHVDGSGVGLHLIKRMIELAGGTITVRSQPGVGSTFTVTLPSA